MIDIENLYESSLSLARNEYLKVQGSVDTNIYFVESGSLQIFLLDDGEEQIIRFGYQNDLIVSMDSFLREKPSAFYIQAIKKSFVKVIPRKKFFDFIYGNEDNQRLYIQKQMIELLDKSRNRSLNKEKIDISISKWIKLKLGDTFRFVIFHNIRHIKQIERIFTEMEISGNKQPQQAALK